jgi:hypothetical protein
MGLIYRQSFFFFPIDVDNDGKQDAMVQRGVNGQRVYFVRRSSDGQMYSLAWGAVTSPFFPQFGDYDGDGKTDFASRQTLHRRRRGSSLAHLSKLDANAPHR